MAFQFTALGQALEFKPETVHARLVEVFERHSCSTSAVAKDLGVSVVTIRRWVQKLESLGFTDPGGGARRVRGKGRGAAVR